MLLMVVGIAALVAMDATVKLLVVEDIHAIQLLALRSIMIVPAIYLVFRLRGEGKQLMPGRWSWQIFRAIIGFIAPCCFFMSLVFLPQADAVVIFFAAPLIITLCSVLFLGESFGRHRWIAVVIGFIGVVIALNPAGSIHWQGYVLAIIGTITYAGLFLTGRYLSKTESTPSLVMSYNVGVGFIGLALLPSVWTGMDAGQWAVLCLLALLAVTGHFCITAAFASAEASLLSPFEYTALFWAVLYDWLLWHDAPNPHTLTGGAIVIAAGLYFIYRERLKDNNPSE
ncbi:MAG: DMT family transporter [Pseudomonadota bacterium]